MNMCILVVTQKCNNLYSWKCNVKQWDIRKANWVAINNMLYSINQINTTSNDIDIKVVKQNIE